MYPSLPGNLSLWSVKTTQVALAKADALKQEDVSREHHCIDMYCFFQVCMYLSQRNKMQWQAVARDEETIQTIIALDSHFWKEYVLKDLPPPVDEHSGEVLAMLYPKSEEKSVILPAEADEPVAQWIELKKAEDDLKTANPHVKKISMSC